MLFVTYFVIVFLKHYLSYDVEQKVTDFSAILNEMRDLGVNDYKVSAATGIERSKISKLRTGDRKQPNYDDGAAIVKLYKREIKNAKR